MARNYQLGDVDGVSHDNIWRFNQMRHAEGGQDHEAGRGQQGQDAVFEKH